MIFCIPMELEDCHEGTHGCTDRNFVPCVLVHISSHEEIREYRRKANDYHTDVVLMTIPPQGRQILWQLHRQSHFWASH
jgi:hypothetical protein